MLNAEAKRVRFVSLLRAQLGQPYLWGGEGPMGFDCSGLIIYCLHGCGCKINDRNAQDIYYLFNECEVESVTMPGQLLFYGASKKAISHVMICLTVWEDGMYVIAGARGGTSKTVSTVEAWNSGALVDVCRGDYWKNKMVAIVDPFKF